MASDSGAKGSVDSYIGCFISLISKYEIRYEGVLYFLNAQDSTIGLKNVRSYGTEGRRKDGPQVPPSDKTYEYILFRGNDIKDLQVKSPPASFKSQTEEQVLNDPAIVQSQFSGVSSPVPSVGGRSFTESVQRHDTPAMTSRALPVGFPSHQYVTHPGPSNQSSATRVPIHSSFSAPMYRKRNNGESSNSSYSLHQSSPIQPPSVISPLTMQYRMQTPETQAPTNVGWTTLSDCGLPLSPTSASSLVNPTSPCLTSVQNSNSLDIPGLLSTKTPMPSAPMTSNGSNTSLLTSPFPDTSSVDCQIFGKSYPDLRPSYPGHSIHHSASSFVDSTSGPLPASPSLLTPDQFAQPKPHFFPSTHILTPNQKDMDPLPPTSSSSSVLVPSPASQAPLLPLPNSVQKYSASQFPEEFDFEAMNEKFKKDEVWGSLGKATQKLEAVEDNECRGLLPNPKPAYNKDDFFDSISCNSMTRGSRNPQNRFSERMKQDAETFGNFQQRHNFSGNGAGRGENFTGSYNRGRDYDYGRRGHGTNPPF